jgi:hypothetical protein
MAKQAWQYKEFGTLIYPDDSNKTEEFDFPDCIRFGVRKRDGVQIKHFKKAFGGSATHARRNLGKAYEKAGMDAGWYKKKEEELKKNGDKSDKQLQEEIHAAYQVAFKNREKTNGPASNLMELTIESIAIGASILRSEQQNQKQNDLQAQKQSTHLLGSIYLNMPQAFQLNEEANWGGQELGVMGAKTQDILTGGNKTGMNSELASGTAVGNVGNIVGSAIGGIPALMTKMGVSGGLLGAGLGAMAAGSPIQKGVESALKIAENPYMEMMFSGIGFRNFQFDFIFRPKSEKEQKTVHHIIKMFRLNSRPTMTQEGLGTGFMNYPMEFEVEFLTRPAEKKGGFKSKVGFDSFTRNTSIPEIKPCVCNSVVTNYTPDNMWSAHDSGRPTAIQLSLGFKETELVMAEDIADGYSTYGGN